MGAHRKAKWKRARRWGALASMVAVRAQRPSDRGFLVRLARGRRGLATIGIARLYLAIVLFSVFFLLNIGIVSACFGAQHTEHFNEKVGALITQNPRELHPVMVGNFILLDARFLVGRGQHRHL